MLNIEVQMCGLVIDLLLIYFAFKHDRVGLYSERLFLISIFANTLCVALDIASIIAIVYMDELPIFVVDAISKLYLVMLVCAAYLALMYISSDIPRLKTSSRYKSTNFAVFAASAVLILLLPINYYHEGRAIYSYGPADVATFIYIEQTQKKSCSRLDDSRDHSSRDTVRQSTASFSGIRFLDRTYYPICRA